MKGYKFKLKIKSFAKDKKEKITFVYNIKVWDFTAKSIKFPPRQSPVR